MSRLVFVDTSVWVDALRGRNADVATRLRLLLDEDRVALAAPVRLEILSGASARMLSTLRRTLSALPLYFPSIATWARIEGWLEQAVQAGQRFGVGDLLIAGIASDQSGTLWSLDRDFSRLADLGLIELFDAKRRTSSAE